MEPEITSDEKKKDKYFGPFIGMSMLCALLVLIIAYAVIDNANKPNVDIYKNIKTMLVGCIATVGQKPPDKAPSWYMGASEIYYSDTVAKTVMTCMSETGYTAFDTVNNQSITDGVAYAVVSGCTGTLISVSEIYAYSNKEYMASCVVDNGKISWRSNLSPTAILTVTPNTRG